MKRAKTEGEESGRAYSNSSPEAHSRGCFEMEGFGRPDLFDNSDSRIRYEAYRCKGFAVL